MRRLFAALCICLFTWPQLAVAERQSRPMDEKAALTTALLPVPRATLKRDVLPKALIDLSLRPGHQQDRFVVKFAEDLRVRLRAGELVELAGSRSRAAAARAPRDAGGGSSSARKAISMRPGQASTRARFGRRSQQLLPGQLAKGRRGAIAARWLASRGSVPRTSRPSRGGVRRCGRPTSRRQRDYLEPAPGGVNAFDAWNFNPAGAGWRAVSATSIRLEREPQTSAMWRS